MSSSAATDEHNQSNVIILNVAYNYSNVESHVLIHDFTPCNTAKEY